MTPYHPDYGLPQNKRDAVIADARRLGPIAAAAVHNVGLTSVYRWLKDAGFEINPNPER